MAFGLFFTQDDNFGGNIELFLDKEFYTKKMAESAFNEQLSILANHEKCNEFQPTKISKDVFHFYVKMENGTEQKRGFFISRVYKTEKYSLRTVSDARQKALKFNLISNF